MATALPLAERLSLCWTFHFESIQAQRLAAQ